MKGSCTEIRLPPGKEFKVKLVPPSVTLFPSTAAIENERHGIIERIQSLHDRRVGGAPLGTDMVEEHWCDRHIGLFSVHEIVRKGPMGK